jgi:hypothetical protein
MEHGSNGSANMALKLNGNSIMEVVNYLLILERRLLQTVVLIQPVEEY